MEKKSKYDLTEGAVLKKLLLFTIPIFGANILQALYGTVDLLIVGKFADAAAVSGVSTGTMIIHTFTAVVAGLAMGSTILLGHNIGARDYAAATRTVYAAILLFVVMGVLLAVAIPVLAVPASQIMNTPAEAFDATVSYTRVCGVGILFIILFNAMSGLFRGAGDSVTPLVLMSIASVGNIIGDLILVAVFHMDAFGAAVATVAAQGASAVSAVVLMNVKGIGFALVPEQKKPGRKELRRIVLYGAPIAAQEVLTTISFTIILAILNTFGLVASAGVGIAEKICNLIFIVPMALMSGISAFAAQNIGAGLEKRARKGLYYGMAVSVGVGVFMFLAGFFRGVDLASMFSNDYEVCLAAADYLKAYAIDCILVGFNFALIGYLNGCGRTGFVALQGILSTFLVRIPVSWFMSRMAGATLFTVGLATPLASLAAIIITVIYMNRMDKLSNKN